VAIAGVLLAAIYIPFQQANAFTVTVGLPDAEGVNNEISNSIAGEPFEIEIDVAAGELISVEEVKLILDNGEATVKNAVFDSVGDLDSGDNDLVINNEIVISALSDGGYAYGFGTVSDGITGTTGYSFNFVSTEDFIGGNTIGPDNDVTDFVIGLLGPGTITITGCTLRTADLATGTHTLDVLINTGAGANPDELTIDPPFEFDVVEDDSVIVAEESVPASSTTADIVTTDSDGDPVNIGLNFDAPTTTTGNAVVVVQNTDEFLADHTPEELAALGFEESTSLTFVTDTGNTIYNPVGFIMDIDLSALGLPDGTEVTISMNYNDSGLDEDEEQRVRLMHQLDDLSGWEVLTNENETINDGDEVDIVANIVYGTTDDFSLFAPAVGTVTGGGGGGGESGGTVVITWPPTVGTFPESYFEEHPLAKIQVSTSAFVNAGGVSIDRLRWDNS
jgi:hypothetical protein